MSDVATREIQKSFSTVLFIHTSDYLRYLTRKQTVIHLPTPENVTTLTCELQNFFIRLKVRCLQCFECLQCFDAVGWAAGRASGL